MHYHVGFAALQLAALLFCAASQRVDRTLEEGARGDDVVIATVNKISDSGIFRDDHQFLRRMAYVETNFGETATPGSGGIWNVSETVFRVATRAILISYFRPYGELFESFFGFKWSETVVIDNCLLTNVCNRQKLDVPLYSALSVMVFIEVFSRTIEDSITQQAQLWRDLFKSHSPDIYAEFFIEKAHILLNQLPPSCIYSEGEETVIVTVNKIAGSGIFPNDFQFLKHMAYIETNYGQTATPGDGGIWAISMDMLRITTRYILYHPQGQQLGKEIVRAFNFNWTATVIVDDCDTVCNRTQMNIPLYSALAVMIYIRILDRTIQDDVIQQSLLWKQVFKTSDTNKEFFSDKVEEMMRAGAKYKGVDMIFVMDESGSIGAANFELLKGFALQIIETFEIGPNQTQVGWINFNQNARVVFNLNTYQDIASLQAGVHAVTYSGGLTNISTGMLALNNILSTGGRSRFDIPEVAIVVIGSQSDIVSIRNAAALLHRERNVEVFVIGVGSGIAVQQLNAVAEAGIASDISRNIFTLSSFNEEELDHLQETPRARTCFSFIFSEVTFEHLNATSTVPEGARAYVNTVCPEGGLTINACGEDGAIFIYISRNPSIATYDVIIQIEEGECVSRFIECDDSDTDGNT